MLEALTISNWISIIGFPSIFAVVAYCVKVVRGYRDEERRHKAETEEKIDLLMVAYQAQMRDSLYQKYKEYMAQGWVDLEDLDTWENSYTSYHSLGKNGVMTSKRDELMHLPNTPPSTAKKN